jgi:hypothetical protein
MEWPYAEAHQQRVRVGGELVQAELVGLRLGGSAEADLVRNDQAITCIAQRTNGVLPDGAAEVLAVQEHDGPAIGLGRLNVHVGHRQRLSLRAERVGLDRIGIGKVGQ